MAVVLCICITIVIVSMIFAFCYLKEHDFSAFEYRVYALEDSNVKIEKRLKCLESKDGDCNA